MPIFAALVALAFEKLFGAWADTLTRKAAIIAAAVAAIAALTVALVGTLSAAVSGIMPALPAGIGTGVWLFVPYNAPACLGVMFAADAALGVYGWARGNVKLAAQVAA